MAVNFYIDKRTDKKGDAPIRVSIVIKGIRYLTSTGYKISPDKWDSTRQQVRRGSSNTSGMTWAAINSALSSIADSFNTIENEYLIKNESPTLEDLKNQYAEQFGRRHSQTTVSKELGFWDYYKMFIDERSVTNQWTAATHQKFNALKVHLTNWKSQISFSDFNESGFASFILYLRDKKQMKNSTICKQIGFVKWFLRWAKMKGYNTNDTYQAFSPKLKIAPHQVVFLDWNELMTVFNYEIPDDGTIVKLHDSNGVEYEKKVHASSGLRIARDVFCFCCFTSLRFSDASNLKRSNINNNSIRLTAIKTTAALTIELNKYAQAVLECYADRKDLGEYALPRIANQRMNLYLKELCELCEINKPITRTYYRGPERIDETYPKYELIGTHTGRRTFICNALMLGIPAEIVMKWTGHSDYKSMKPYVDITNSAKAEAMKKFDER